MLALCVCVCVHVPPGAHVWLWLSLSAGCGLGCVCVSAPQGPSSPCQHPGPPPFHLSENELLIPSHSMCALICFPALWETVSHPLSMQAPLPRESRGPAPGARAPKTSHQMQGSTSAFSSLTLLSCWPEAPGFPLTSPRPCLACDGPSPGPFCLLAVLSRPHLASVWKPLTSVPT